MGETIAYQRALNGTFPPPPLVTDKHTFKMIKLLKNPFEVNESVNISTIATRE